MLEFIVLGRIPGSQLNITFDWVLNCGLLVLCFYLLLLDIKLIRRRRQTMVSQSALQPVSVIQHKGATLRVQIARAKISWIHLLSGPGVH
jgi:hypothetical protein